MRRRIRGSPLTPPRVEGLADTRDPAETLRIYETLEGRGKAYDGERLLAEVDYVLKDVEEVEYTMASREGDGSEARVGERNLYGIVKSPQAGVLGGYVGTSLILQLEDGRLFPFTVAKAIHIHAFLIQGLGGIR